MKVSIFRALAGPVAVLGCALSLTAQQSNSSSTSTSTVNINGNVVSDGRTISQSKSADSSQTVVTTQSINGRSVPLEQVEERVVRNDANGSVIERIVRRYDPEGNALPPTRETIEEQKRPDGGSTRQSTTYRADVNGNMQVLERSVTDTQVSPSGQISQTVVQRPMANGLETVEKQSQVVNKQDKNYQSDSTTYRSDGNGGFYPAVRQTIDHTVQGSQISDNAAEYERDASGQLQLYGQTVSKTVTRPDGSKDAVVDIYSRNVPGTVDGNGGPLQLLEQQVIESAPGPGNTMVQTLSVRRPTVSDPGALGPARQLSQTVCKGDCKPPKDDK